MISASTCAAAVLLLGWAAGELAVGLAEVRADEAADAVGRAAAVVPGELVRGAEELADTGGDGGVVDLCVLGVARRAGAVTTVGDAAMARPAGVEPAGFADAVPVPVPDAGLEDDDAPQPPHSTASISAPGSRNLTRRVPVRMPSLLIGMTLGHRRQILFQHGQTSPDDKHTGNSYRPVADQLMYCGATNGVPTSSCTFSCEARGMSRGFPWKTWPFTMAVTFPLAGPA